ncbi:MAG: hypothetical protein JNM65_13115 [Verrucomicrobiaceae bacterium]|nr:hypothetical protein [Verrucomicrobiaceae bacterium]
MRYDDDPVRTTESGLVLQRRTEHLLRSGQDPRSEEQTQAGFHAIVMTAEQRSQGEILDG